MALMISFSRLVSSVLASVLMALLLFTGCESFGGDEYRPFATEILRVEVAPNPVAAGDTVVFTCVVEDSTDTTLSFIWFLGGELDTTGTNQISRIAPSETGSYSYKVQVVRPGDPSVEPIQERFEVTVVER